MLVCYLTDQLCSSALVSIFKSVISSEDTHCFMHMVPLNFSISVGSSQFYLYDKTSRIAKFASRVLESAQHSSFSLSSDLFKFSVRTVKWMQLQAILTLFPHDQKSDFAQCHSSVDSPLKKRQLVLTFGRYFSKKIGKLFFFKYTVELEHQYACGPICNEPVLLRTDL